MTVTDYIADRFSVAPGAPADVPMSRRDLPGLATAMGYTTGAEVGVWKGEYAAAFCAAGLTMVCVDPWEPYQDWKDTKNSLTGAEAEAFMEAARQAALKKLQPFGSKADIRRLFSVDAAKAVPNQSLDFVYIDGNHGFASVLDDFVAWTPKVRKGGFIAGHDYRDQPKKPFIQVKRAVGHWTRKWEIAPWFVLAGDRTPSFLWEVR